MIENQDIAVQLNFELVQKIYNSQTGETLALTGEINIEPFDNAEFFSKTLKAAFENNSSIKNIQLSNVSVGTINALVSSLQHARTNIKLILVDDLSEVLVSFLCLSLYNNPNRPEIGFVSPPNLSPLCKNMVDQFNKKEGGNIEFMNVNEFQNSDIQPSHKRPFEPNLQAQQAEGSMNKKICLDHNNNMGNGMDVEASQAGHTNQLMTNTIHDSHQHNSQYPHNSQINNFQYTYNSGNIAYPMHMQQQRTDQQQINGYQPYGNYNSNSHYPQSLNYPQNIQQPIPYNSMGNAMNVDLTQFGHANQLMTNNIQNSHQHNPQYPYNLQINNFQNVHNSGNVAQPMHMPQQRTGQQHINGYQPYGNYNSSTHYPQLFSDSQNTQQTMASFPMQNCLNTPTAYNPTISQNLQSPHSDLTEQPKSIETVTALFDYEAEQTGHLAFEKGDIITILEKNNHGWWLGELHSKKGWVPSNFIKQGDENQSKIWKFLKKNPTDGIEMLAQLIIDHKNIPIVDPDENLQEIKYLLDDESYNSIIRKAILEEISHRTKIGDHFQDDYTVAQILLWVSKQNYAYDLCMRHNNLGNLSPDQWTAFFAVLKGFGITSLNLLSSNLNNLSPDQWTAFCGGLKDSGITSLDLACNHLYKLSPDQWTAFFAASKGSGITSLDLACNDLYSSSPDQWTAFCAGLKGSGITSLDLGSDNLNYISPDQWTAFFAGLKCSGITSLMLNDAALGSSDPDRWTAFCAGLKDSGITSFDLRGNHLIDLSLDQWTAFCAGLKGSGITSLDLSSNELNDLSPDQWIEFCAGLKGSDVTSLNLDDNNLDDRNMQQVAEIIQENLDCIKEIEKNAIVLGYLQYNSDSRFSKLPVERLFDIASGMGKDENVIENDKTALEIVKKNFPSFDSDNEEDASQKAEEEFQKYSANFKF